MEEERRMNLAELFAGTITRPAATFKRITVPTAVWLVIIMALLGLFFSVWTGFSTVSADTMPLPPPGVERVTEVRVPEVRVPERDEQIIMEPVVPAAASPMILFMALVGALVSFAFGWVLKSSVMMGLVSFSGGRITWVQSLAVVGASWVAFFVYHLFKGTVTMVTGEVYIAASDAARILAPHLNIFVIWNMILLTVGFAVVSGVPRARVAAMVAGYQAVVILANLGFHRLQALFTTRF